MSARWESADGYGLTDAKREGAKVGPATFLTLRGEWPPRSFYSDEEYAQLQQDGWTCVEE